MNKLVAGVVVIAAVACSQKDGAASKDKKETAGTRSAAAMVVEN